MNAHVLGIAIVIFALLAASAGQAAAPVTGDLALEPCKYTSGDVEYDAECGTLVVPVKYVTILGASFLATVAVYDLVVKRTNVTRFLFGMRPRKKAPDALAPSTSY